MMITPPPPGNKLRGVFKKHLFVLGSGVAVQPYEAALRRACVARFVVAAFR
jgi:hypothetical protein